LYIAECDDLERNRQYGLELPAGARSWLEATGERRLERTDAIAANNVCNAAGRTYSGDVATERATIAAVREEEDRRHRQMTGDGRKDDDDTSGSSDSENTASSDASSDADIEDVDDTAEKTKNDKGKDASDKAKAKRLREVDRIAAQKKARERDAGTMAQSINRASRAQGYADPVLHCLICRQVRDGTLHLPAGVRAETLFAGTERATVRFAMPAISADAAESLRQSSGFYDGEPCVSRHHHHRQRQHHFLTATLGALAGLARFHPSSAAGLGTPTTPHVGIASACVAARAGSRVLLLPGFYRPASLRHLHGTLRFPLVVCPVGYHRALQHKAFRLGMSEADSAGDGATRDADAIDVAHTATPFGALSNGTTTTTPTTAEDAAPSEGSGFAVAPFAALPPASAVELLRTPLNDDEVAMVAPVVISHRTVKLARVPAFAPASGAVTPVASATPAPALVTTVDGGGDGDDLLPQIDVTKVESDADDDGESVSFRTEATRSVATPAGAAGPQRLQRRAAAPPSDGLLTPSRRRPYLHFLLGIGPDVTQPTDRDDVASSAEFRTVADLEDEHFAAIGRGGGGGDDDGSDESDSDDDGLGDMPLLDVDNCSFVSVLGVRLEGSSVAVAARDTTSVFVRHSRVVGCGLAFSSTDYQDVVPFEGNDVDESVSRLRQRVSAGLLPAWVTVPGFGLAFVLYVFFVLTCLFLTSSLSDAHANAWITQCAVSLVAVGLLLQPLQLSGKASLKFAIATAAATSARLNELLSFV